MSTCTDARTLPSCPASEELLGCYRFLRAGLKQTARCGRQTHGPETPRAGSGRVGLDWTAFDRPPSLVPGLRLVLSTGRDSDVARSRNDCDKTNSLLSSGLGIFIFSGAACRGAGCVPPISWLYGSGGFPPKKELRAPRFSSPCASWECLSLFRLLLTAALVPARERPLSSRYRYRCIQALASALALALCFCLSLP